MNPPLLFLDIDGVLNGHEYDAHAKSCTITPACADRLNIILTITDCRLVISSAWRYMIHRGAMTIRGFEHLLQSHRIRAQDRIIGITREDRSIEEPRALQIAEWWNEHRRDWGDTKAWAIVDDMDLGFTQSLMPFVQTNSNFGLSDANMNDLLKLLGDVKEI